MESADKMQFRNRCIVLEDNTGKDEGGVEEKYDVHKLMKRYIRSWKIKRKKEKRIK